jgi:hypothetical protein
MPTYPRHRAQYRSKAARKWAPSWASRHSAHISSPPTGGPSHAGWIPIPAARSTPASWDSPVRPAPRPAGWAFRPYRFPPLPGPFIAFQHLGRPLDSRIVPPRRLDEAATSPLAKPDRGSARWTLEPPPSAKSGPTSGSIPIRALGVLYKPSFPSAPAPGGKSCEAARTGGRRTRLLSPAPHSGDIPARRWFDAPRPADIFPRWISNRIRARRATRCSVFPRRTRASNRGMSSARNRTPRGFRPAMGPRRSDRGKKVFPGYSWELPAAVGRPAATRRTGSGSSESERRFR